MMFATFKGERISDTAHKPSRRAMMTRQAKMTTATA